MTTIYIIITIVATVLGLAARFMFWNSGRTKENLKNEKARADDLVEEINKLGNRPRMRSDVNRLFERAIVKAKDREKSK